MFNKFCMTYHPFNTLNGSSNYKCYYNCILSTNSLFCYIFLSVDFTSPYTCSNYMQLNYN